MDLNLTDRVFIVADVVGELGRATAECLTAEGARVVMSGHDERELAAAAADQGASEVISVVAGASDADAPERLVAVAQATWGRLDGALVGVGGSAEGHLADVADEEWRAAFESVFLGAVRLSRHIAESLPSGGSLALVLPSGVDVPQADKAVSTGLQRGLAALALELAEELGPRGIRVNVLLAGAVADQRMIERMAVPEDPSRGEVAPIESVPLRRFGTPEEFARVAAFVLSPAASYISGSMIPIDGGLQRSL